MAMAVIQAKRYVTNVISCIIYYVFIFHVLRPGFKRRDLGVSTNTVSRHRRRKVAPTSANPDTAKASVKGVLSLRNISGDAAADDCCAGGVPDEEDGARVEVEAEADVDAEAEGATEPRPLVESSELGRGVSPGGMPIEPSDVTPPLQC
jgi:hypothetical protein